MKFNYPNYDDISDPSERVQADFAPIFEEHARDAQVRYRTLRRSPDSHLEIEFINVVADFAEAVCVSFLERQERLGDLGAARRLFSQAAQLGLDCAYWLYKDLGYGRLPFSWLEKVEMRLTVAVDVAEDQWWFDSAAAPPATGRKAPKEYFLAYRAKNPDITYDQMVGRIGIARDTLFKIKEERAWVREEAYRATAQVLDCRPEDLHPRRPRDVARKKSD